MIKVLMKHNGIYGDMNESDGVLEQLEVLKENTIEVTKEEYFNSKIVFYFNQNKELRFVFFTVEHNINNIDGYIFELSDSSIEEIATFIVDKRNCKIQTILETIQQ